MSNPLPESHVPKLSFNENENSFSSQLPRVFSGEEESYSISVKSSNSSQRSELKPVSQKQEYFFKLEPC